MTKDVRPGFSQTLQNDSFIKNNAYVTRYFIEWGLVTKIKNFLKHSGEYANTKTLITRKLNLVE